MPRLSPIPLAPRKSPVQARSAASVDAILEATIQVLLHIGKEQLTTTRVAHRAGVSVGTLYQYFPNKSALLQAALRRHLDDVTSATEQVCREQHGNCLDGMATALVAAFLAAKMRHPETSVALYAVSSDLDAAGIVKELSTRASDAIVTMLETAPEPLARDPRLIASVLQGAMAGVSRRLLESPNPSRLLNAFQNELITLARTYLRSCSITSEDQPRSSQPKPLPSLSCQAKPVLPSRPKRNAAQGPASPSQLKPAPLPTTPRPSPWT